MKILLSFTHPHVISNLLLFIYFLRFNEVQCCCVKIQSKGFTYFSPNNCKAQTKTNFSDNVSQAEFYPIQINLFSFACSVTAAAVNVGAGVVMCHEFSLRLVWVNWPFTEMTAWPYHSICFFLKLFPGILDHLFWAHPCYWSWLFFFLLAYNTQCCISYISEFTNPREYFMDILEYWIDIVP